MRIGPRKIAFLALGAALMFGLQVAMAALPNIEPVSLVVILLTVCCGWDALWSVAVFVLLEGLTYGFGLWFFFYLYAWPLLVVLTMLLRPAIGDSAIGLSLLSAAFGLFFGLLYALMFLVIGGISTMLSTWVAGFVFDIAHCVGNFVLGIALFSPLLRIVKKFAWR